MAESKYAKRLREYGFELEPPEAQERYKTYLMEAARQAFALRGEPFTRPLRRQAEKTLKKPAFSIIREAIGVDTFARDEQGKIWRAKDKSVDLSALGFADHGLQITEIISAQMRDGQSLH